MRTSLDSPLDNHVYHYGRELELIEDSGFFLFLYDVVIMPFLRVSQRQEYRRSMSRYITVGQML